MINEDNFIEKLELINNPFTKEGSYENKLFETYGRELASVDAHYHRGNQIFTLVEGKEDKLYLLGGYHLVNRLGYFVSALPRSAKFNEIELEV